MIKRALAIVATLALLGVGAAIATMVRDSWTEAQAFHPAAFRAAAANENADALKDEARAAIRHRALHGRSRAEVRALVGKPDRVDRTLHLYQWDVQLNTWFFGLPEGGCVCVELNQWGQDDGRRPGRAGRAVRLSGPSGGQISASATSGSPVVMRANTRRSFHRGEPG